MQALPKRAVERDSFLLDEPHGWQRYLLILRWVLKHVLSVRRLLNATGHCITHGKPQAIAHIIL